MSVTEKKNKGIIENFRIQNEVSKGFKPPYAPHTRGFKPPYAPHTRGVQEQLISRIKRLAKVLSALCCVRLSTF